MNIHERSLAYYYQLPRQLSSMRPALFAIRTTGFTFFRRIGGFTEAIGKCQCSYAGVYKIMESGSRILDIGDGATWTKRVQDITDI